MPTFQRPASIRARFRAAGLILLSFLLFFAVFALGAAGLHDAGHRCTGENCPVCRMLALRRSAGHFIGGVLLCLAAVLCPLRAKTRFSARTRVSAPSPVKLAVKLTD